MTGKALTDDYVTKTYLDSKLAEVKADVLLLKWMIGFNLAISAGVLLKLLS